MMSLFYTGFYAINIAKPANTPAITINITLAMITYNNNLPATSNKCCMLTSFYYKEIYFCEKERDALFGIPIFFLRNHDVVFGEMLLEIFIVLC